MTEDEWQRHATREAARAVGRWLEARGRLHESVSALTLADLEAMAAAAVSRYVVLASERRRETGDAEALTGLMLM